jgi:hypothetical protein
VQITYHVEVITVKKALTKREDIVYEFERFVVCVLKYLSLNSVVIMLLAYL